MGLRLRCSLGFKILSVHKETSVKCSFLGSRERAVHPHATVSKIRGVTIKRVVAVLRGRDGLVLGLVARRVNCVLWFVAVVVLCSATMLLGVSESGPSTASPRTGTRVLWMSCRDPRV